MRGRVEEPSETPMNRTRPGTPGSPHKVIRGEDKPDTDFGLGVERPPELPISGTGSKE
jgi:hypothetical protein